MADEAAQGVVECSVPEVKVDEASASTQEALPEPALVEQQDGDAEVFEEVVAEPGSGGNKANANFMQDISDQEVIAINQRYAPREQTQSTTLPASSPRVKPSCWRRDVGPEAASAGLSPPETPVDLDTTGELDAEPGGCDGSRSGPA